MDKFKEEEFKKVLFDMRFPNGHPTCPVCKAVVKDYLNKTSFECLACRRKDKNKRVRFNMYTCTPLEQTKLSAEQIIFLTSFFCSNVHPEKILEIHRKAIDRFYNTAKDAIYRQYPVSEYETLKKDKSSVFGVLPKGKLISIVPIPELKPGLLRKMEKRGELFNGPYSEYPVFITGKNSCMLKNERKGIPVECVMQKGKSNITELSFLRYYQANFENKTLSRLHYKNLYGYLKIAEYFYNLEIKNPGISNNQKTEHLLNLLLKIGTKCDQTTTISSV